jgi:hypothetical protein
VVVVTPEVAAPVAAGRTWEEPTMPSPFLPPLSKEAK